VRKCHEAAEGNITDAGIEQVHSVSTRQCRRLSDAIGSATYHVNRRTSPRSCGAGVH